MRYTSTTASSLFPASEKNERTIFEKLESSSTPITVSRIDGQRIITLRDLIAETQAAGKSFVLTVSPGPFKSSTELPSTWMKTDLAKGCTLQLQNFQKHFEELDAVVVSANPHLPDYQCGAEGLLAVKGLNGLQMIQLTSELIAELGLKSFSLLPEEKFDETATIKASATYPERITFVRACDGEWKELHLESPVTEDGIKDHINAIRDFNKEHGIVSIATATHS